MGLAVGNIPFPATGGGVWVAGARIATPAPGLLKVPGRLEFAMCVRPQPFEGAEAAHFPLGPKLPRSHVASEIRDKLCPPTLLT